MNKILFTTTTIILLLIGNCWAADFSLVLNDDSIQGVLNQTLDSNEQGQSLAGFRLLYADHEDTLLGSVGAGVQGELGYIHGLTLGAQVTGNLGSSDKEELLTFGLGVSGSYQLPQLMGLRAYGRIHYAPELLSFLDSEGLWETAVGVSFAFNPKATIMVEYQNIEADFKTIGTRNIDESIRAGIQFYF